MQTRTRQGTVSTKLLWHVPAVLVLAIYLPAALLGMYIFRDVYAASFLALLAVFTAIYYGSYPWFLRGLQSAGLRSSLWRVGDSIPWRSLAWLAVISYAATIVIAALTVAATPLATALNGGHLYEIAAARAEFLAKREGPEALLRYLAIILGRAVLPFLITYAYWTGHRARHVALAALLFCYLVPLEKASPLFVFVPLILLCSLQANWKAALAHGVSLLACVAIWTFLGMAGLHDSRQPESGNVSHPATIRQPPVATPEVGEVRHQGDPRRHYIFYSMDNLELHQQGKSVVLDQFLWMVNRVFWSPYVTAYDWLKFQDDVLGGQLTLGRQIGVVSWLLGKPRLGLEQMVYQYQYGASPGGAGASNAIFLVDSKLAFGWLGVVISCALFTFFSAIVFSSDNPVAQIASVTSFLNGALSPLTATLLSGGLLFYIAVSLLTRLSQDASLVPGKWRGA
jgi:hypothetical protein